MAASSVPALAKAQQHRDFIREDDEGHLILRFASDQATDLTANQHEEVVNAFVSVMVHDRLRADVLFEAEHAAAERALSKESLLWEHAAATATGLRVLDAECRALSCRIVFGHDAVWSVSAHQALISTAQDSLHKFLASHAHDFEAGFMLAGYYQESETQYIKGYIRRTRAALSDVSE